MKTKSRDYRKLQRARSRYWKALEDGVGYGEGLMYVQLNMMYVARWFFKKYPKPLPKMGLMYKQKQP